ncbi:MAG: tetratricopeptide repeat protein [Spirochaetia bacterium]|nr:tetratricopeptide repeat protein [Spirochaetia bacterium]
MYDKALEAFIGALNIDPNYLSAWTNTGYIYQAKEEYEKAVKSFEKSLILNPKSAKIYNIIGLIYDKMDKPDIAVKMYKKAVQLDSTYANSHYMLGRLYRNRGNIDKSVAEFTKHIRIHEYGNMVDDAIRRIAEMKSMTFDDVKKLSSLHAEESAENPMTSLNPPHRMEKADESNYTKGKITGIESDAAPQLFPFPPPGPVEPPVTVSPAPSMTQQPVRLPSAVFEFISQPDANIMDFPPRPDEIPPRIDIPVVSFEQPVMPQQGSVFDSAAFQLPHEAYMETVIEPAGGGPLPADSMPEFSKQPHPGPRQYNQPTYEAHISGVGPIPPVSGPIGPTEAPLHGIQQQAKPARNPQQKFELPEQPPKKDDDGGKSKIKHNFY